MWLNFLLKWWNVYLISSHVFDRDFLVIFLQFHPFFPASICSVLFQKKRKMHFQKEPRVDSFARLWFKKTKTTNQPTNQPTRVLGCPWNLVTILRKLGCNLLRGLTTYIYGGYNLFTKYHGHPGRSKNLLPKKNYPPVKCVTP